MQDEISEADFNVNMTKEIILEAITLLHNKGFNVAAIVSDCGTPNRGLLNSLSVNLINTSFPHPVTHSPIYTFADVPHLIKLFRNWLLKPGGIQLESGISVTSRPLQKLYELTRTEINSMFKLSFGHLNLNSTEKQNVRLAVQLLSATVAEGLLKYVAENEDCSIDLRTEARALAEVITIVNNWFDVMNSRTTHESINFKKPFGLALEVQLEALEKMNNLVKAMNCKRISELETFQQGILQCNKSVVELFNYAKQKYNMTYLLTKHLNQDSLEGSFGQIRARNGSDDKPSPLKCLHSIKVITLGKNIANLKRNANSPEELNVYSLVGESFKKANIIVEIPEYEEESDSSSLSSVDSNLSAPKNKTEESEADGLEYLSGFLAMKFKKKGMDLGSYSYLLKDEDNPSYVQRLSKGGLTVPNPGWLALCQKMMHYFKKYNNDEPGKVQFKHETGVKTRIAAAIAKKIPDLDKTVIDAFVKGAIKIRCKHINKNKTVKKKIPGKQTTRQRKLALLNVQSKSTKW